MSFTQQPSANAPRPYDLDDPQEIARLHRELRGYLSTCQRQHHGTDMPGRNYALLALETLVSKNL